MENRLGWKRCAAAKGYVSSVLKGYISDFDLVLNLLVTAIEYVALILPFLGE
jgi:hypothetical protein